MGEILKPKTLDKNWVIIERVMTLVSFIVAMLAISCGSCTIGKAWEDLHLSLLNSSTCFDTSYSHPCMGCEDDSKLALLFPPLNLHTHFWVLLYSLQKEKSCIQELPMFKICWYFYKCNLNFFLFLDFWFCGRNGDYVVLFILLGVTLDSFEKS